MLIQENNGKKTLTQAEDADFHKGAFIFTEDVDTLGAFSFCDRSIKLKTITLPDKVKRIDGSAFATCENLESINLENVIEILDFAFLSCSKLTRVDVTSAKKILLSTFESCINLEYANLNSKHLTEISMSLLRGCSSLKTVVLSGTVINIDPTAFDGCTSLERIIVDGDDKEVERIKELLPEDLRSLILPLSLLNQINELQHKSQVEFQSACLNKLRNLPIDLLNTHIYSSAPRPEALQLKEAWKLIPFPSSKEDLDRYKSELERLKQRYLLASKLKDYIRTLERTPKGFFAENEIGRKTKDQFFKTKIVIGKVISFMKGEPCSELSDEEKKLIKTKPILLGLISQSLRAELGIDNSCVIHREVTLS